MTSETVRPVESLASIGGGTTLPGDGALRESGYTRIHFGKHRLVELPVRRRHDRHLILAARSEQGATRERLAVGVRHDRAGLLEHERGGGQVVRGVVEQLSATDPPELLLHPRAPRHEPRAVLDVAVELPGHDPGHVERRRSELERGAPDRRAVDQAADHLDRRPRRATAEAVGPEHAVDPLVLRQPQRRPLDDPVPPLGEEDGTGGDLDDAGERHLAHRDAVPERRRGNRHAARLEPCHRGARAVDRIHDEHLGRVRRAGRQHESAVLRVERHVRPTLCEPRLEQGLGLLVDPEGHVAAGGQLARVHAAGVRAEHRQHLLAERERELAYQLPHYGMPGVAGSGLSGRGASVTVSVLLEFPRRTVSRTVSPRLRRLITYGKSTDWVSGLPSTATIASPPCGMSFWPWNETFPSPAWMPASAAGLPGSTFATSAPCCAGMPRRRASCG